MENKIIAIEVGEYYSFENEKLKLIKDFTTNKNYLGHLDGVPVYYSKFLEKGERKEIMSNQEIKTLSDGKYLAKVEQVIRKHGKDAAGNDDPTKEVISIELNVKDHNDKFYYLSFCVKGYSEIQMQIANETINEIMSDFNISILEELAGKVVVVTAKTNDKGYTNLYIAPQKEFFDWNSYLGFQYTNKLEFACDVKKLYKNKVGNKYTFIVNTNVNGKQVEEFVCYNLDREFDNQYFEQAINRLGISLENDCDKELNKSCKLIITKKLKDDVSYFYKKLGFEKKQPKKPQAW